MFLSRTWRGRGLTSDLTFGPTVAEATGGNNLPTSVWPFVGNDAGTQVDFRRFVGLCLYKQSAPAAGVRTVRIWHKTRFIGDDA